MSKSLGNFVTIRDVLERHHGETLRFYLLSSQYRQPLKYSEEGLDEAHQRLLKLYGALRDLSLEPEGSSEVGAQFRHNFEAALANDFDTVGALSVLAEAARELLRRRDCGEEGAPELAAELRSMGAVIGLLGRDPVEVLQGRAAQDTEFKAWVEGLIEERAAARKSKDFSRADEIRDILGEKGVVIEDGAGGATWRQEGPSAMAMS